MKIIITGATGLIGAEVVRQGIKDPDITELILLVRSEPEFKHPKITVVLHKDFLDYTVAAEYFSKADAIAWCLGISQTQVSKTRYEIITHGYVDACIRFCMQVNPTIRFVFVSGDGADTTERSRTLFKRIKGKAENALLQSGLTNFFIVRPDAVNPRHKNKKAPLAYKLAYPFFPLVEKLAPHKIIWSDVLAKALIQIIKNGYEKNLLENVELRELGK
jgi:nucleoside-diphosphate-sugar epimerase